MTACTDVMRPVCLSVQLTTCTTFVPAAAVSCGQLLSFAASYNPNPVPLCVDGYTLASGKVACRQAGYDTGRASITSYKCVRP